MQSYMINIEKDVTSKDVGVGRKKFSNLLSRNRINYCVVEKGQVANSSSSV